MSTRQSGVTWRTGTGESAGGQRGYSWIGRLGGERTLRSAAFAGASPGRLGSRRFWDSGLGVSISRHRIPERADATYIDLACLDQAVAATFAAVAADIAEQAVHAEPATRSAKSSPP